MRSRYLCLLILMYMATTYFQMCVSSEVIEETSESQEIEGIPVTLEDKQMFLHIIWEQVHQLNEVKMTGLYNIVSELLLNEDSDKLPEHIIHKHPHTQYSQQSSSTQSSGWTNVTLSAPSCVKPGAMCTHDFRNITENGNGWTESVFERSPNNFHSKTCCNKDLCNNNYCCTPTPATVDHSICTYDFDCCDYDLGKSICDTTVGICKLRMGKPCTLASECIRGQCDNGICCYPSLGLPNPPVNSTATPCTSNSECCAGGTCGIDGICRTDADGSCICGANCISGLCVDGKCCYPLGGQCTSASNCCVPNSQCTRNKCCSPINGPCLLPTDCCGNGPLIYCNPSHKCHQIREAVVCQESNMFLFCGSASEQLHIIYANFGRTSTTVCPNVNGQVTNCFQPASTHIVSLECEGKQSCSIAATTAVFGNPCPGTYKYLEVHYDCF